MAGMASNMAKAMGLKGAAALARWGKVQEESDDNPADLCRRLRACLPPELSWYDRSLSALADALASK